MKQPDTPPVLGLQDALAMVEEDKTEMDKVLELLLDPQNIAHNTELNRPELLAFSALGTLADSYPQLTALKQFLMKNLMLRVSLGRKGRKEWVKITSRQLTMADQNPMMDGNKNGTFGRFFRKR